MADERHPAEEAAFAGRVEELLDAESLAVPAIVLAVSLRRSSRSSAGGARGGC